MCLSVQPLTVKDKVLYVGEANHPEFGTVHVFGMSASVAMMYEGENLIFFPTPCLNELNEGSIFKTRVSTALPNMVATITQALLPDSSLPTQGIQTLVANSAAEIMDVLESYTAIQIDNAEAYASFIGEFYPGCSVVICAFDGSIEFRNLTVWYWYRPSRPDMLFLPTLTSMATFVAIDSEVPCDYWAIMSTREMKGGTPVTNSKASSRDIPYLPTKIIGRHFTGWHKNADTVSASEAIQNGMSDGIHRRPFLGIQHG